MTTTASTPAPGRSLIVLLGSLVMVGPLAVDMYLPSLPDIAADLAAHPAEVQQTITVFLLGFAVGMLVYGPVSDRFGRRPVIALGLAYVPTMVRVVRGTVLSIREREYVEASRMIGNGEGYTMARHVLPNAVAPIAVLATSMFGWVLLSESALSFLGLGVPPPAPTWGNMLAASRPHMDTAVWLSIAPGLCIALTLLGINLLGDGLRDRLDPRMAVA